MKKPYEPSFDIIRAVSAVAIVFTHYSYSFYEYGIKYSGPDMLEFTNGDFGGVFVAVFFMLSGAALLYNYPHLSGGEDPSALNTLKKTLTFYKKRWLSIFPMFYIAWAIMYVINSKRVGGWFWGGPRKNFFLTFLGMDGYFLHLGMNYYCLGEWFLGGIIFMYLFYPFLLFLWNRARIPLTVIITFLFCFNLRRHYFSSAPDTNIFIVLIKYYNSHIVISDNMCIWTCLFDFFMGFILVTYALPAVKKINKSRTGIITGTALIILLLLPFLIIPLPIILKPEVCAVMAALIFILLTILTPVLTGNNGIRSLFRLISRYSYGVFLVHHVMIYGIMWLVKDFIFYRLSSFVFFIPLFTVILIAGIILSKASDAAVDQISRVLRKFLRPEKQAEM